MSKKMEELRDMLCEELWKVSKKGELSSPAELDAIDKLTHSIKSIDTIAAMEESYNGGDRYSERNGRSSYTNGSYNNSYNEGGNSYARGRGRYARRDSLGRYSRENRYSREDGREEILELVNQMMNSNPDEEMRQAIRDFKIQIESM